MCDKITCDFVAIYGVLGVLFYAVQAFFNNDEKTIKELFTFGYAKDEAKNVVCMNLNGTVGFSCSQYCNGLHYSILRVFIGGILAFK
ncbi:MULTISPECIES: hypothetical protein [unclassified Bartonella]|uniref:hypothetical protein n=1 Tax=unclassified Bartonella TaxID=2645622 RepID=UPI0035CF48E5